MAIDTIAVTGGNGKIGAAIVAEFVDAGYHTVNLSREPDDDSLAHEYRRVDLLDAGEVYGAFAASDIDAVVHMGTLRGPTTAPAHICFESSVMTSWNVLEAATELGVEAVVLPSSVNAMGAAYQAAPTEVDYLPVDEDHRLTPRDPYGIAKQATERAGAGIGRLPDAPKIAALRYPWVATTEELRDAFVVPDRSIDAHVEAWSHTARDVIFSYLHIADAATIARRAIEADFDGYETFWAVAADTTVSDPSADVVDAFFPDAEVRRPLEGRESLISIEKGRRLLDWEPDHSWTTL